MQLKHEMVSRGRQLNLGIATVFAKKKHLHYFVLPELVCGPHSTQRFWRISIKGCINMHFNREV